MFFSDRSTINRERRTNKTNKQHVNFLKVMTSRKSILSQSRMKRNETPIAHFHEYLIVFNFWDIWHDSVDRSIRDETLLTMFANRKRARDFWERETHRRKSRNSRRWRASRVFHRDVHCWKCFEFDRFESRWNRRIEIWRNARLYEIIVSSIAFVKIAWKQRLVLTCLQIKWTRFFSEHANQIVHSEIKSRCRDSRRNRRTNKVCIFQQFAHRFGCRNRKTKEFRRNKSWNYFCSKYRFLWCCNRQRFWNDFERSRNSWWLDYNFRWRKRWRDDRLKRWNRRFWDLRKERNNWLRFFDVTSTNMLVKFDIVLEFDRMFATFARISFNSFFDQTSFLFLFCQLFHFFLSLFLIFNSCFRKW